MPTTFRMIDVIARDLAAQCAERGEFIPSDLFSRFRRACKKAGLDPAEVYAEARAKRDAEDHICWIDDTTCADCGGAR